MVLPLLLWECVVCQAGLVINEFLPDPVGPDSGKEFVELLNAGSEAINLEGVELQFANGATGGPWLSRWRETTAVELQPGEYFLLVDRNWQGPEPFQEEAWLGLQNGPDTIRLVKDGVQLDLVGYGSLTDEEFFETTPATMVPGSSLARRPDGRDTNDNGADFVSGESTPGKQNFRQFDLQVISAVFAPPSSSQPGLRLQVMASFQNVGLLDIPPCPAEVWFQYPSGEEYRVLETVFSGCALQDRCPVLFSFPTAESGCFSVVVALTLPGGNSVLRLRLGSYQVGPGPLLINEVLASPSRHQGEWIELRAGLQRVSLGDFELKDEEGTWRALPSLELDPNQLVVLAQDSLSLVSWHEENSSLNAPLNCPREQFFNCLRQFPGTWPSLNNTPPEDRDYADRVWLADATGTVIDFVDIPDSRLFPQSYGSSWEKVFTSVPGTSQGEWRPSIAPAGSTPGCENSFGPIEISPGRFETTPRILDSRKGISALHILFSVEPGEAGWHLQIFDLWGSMVRDLGGEERTPGQVELIWDGRDDQGRRVIQGGYVVLLNKSDSAGNFHPSGKQLVVVR